MGAHTAGWLYLVFETKLGRKKRREPAEKQNRRGFGAIQQNRVSISLSITERRERRREEGRRMEGWRE